ncbi:MAG: hypothetical protein ACI4RD_04215 [Kiritimatiellia bacterium]
MAALEQVRAIVDARIAAHRKRRAERRLAEFSRLCAGCDEEAPAAPSGMTDEDGVEKSECRPRIEGAKRFREPPPRMSSRLPENLNVPSVEPRPPNLKAANLSFAARLVIAVRDKFGGDAPKVYMAAHVSRQAYSQIVSDETRPVSKRTAIRFAFALKATPDEARLLLKSAGYAFSNSKTEDFVLQACLEVNPPIWDLSAVNRLLKEYRVDFQY